jgi:response regulator RpfG family c-di-GMP phosphodiesterase
MDKTPVRERPNILFVDDEENVLRSLFRLFIDEECAVFTAPSGGDGLEILARHEIAVVVSDQDMPEMRGTEFLALVKERSPDTIRMILTGQAELSAAVDAINRGGAYQYVTKPWDNDSLLMSLRGAIERYQLVKENKYLTELTLRQKDELQKWSAELEMHVQQQTVDLQRKNKELARLNEKVTRNLRSFTVTVSNLIELRDKTVASHSVTVAAISREMARFLGLTAEETENITIAAQLHDIGKIGLSDAALPKRFEALTLDEAAEYRRHPVRGQAAIDSNEVISEAGVMIRGHHESFDGTGFPDGLKGGEIPLGSRIISIADRYDRVHRDTSIDVALQEVWSLRSKYFDPDLYNPLEKVVKDGKWHALPSDHSVEKEIPLDDLRIGMILSREVRGGTGVLVLPSGVKLDGPRIESIKGHFKLDPPDRPVAYVWPAK